MKRQISDQSARKSVLEAWPRLQIYLSLSQRTSQTESHCEWIFGTAIWMALFLQQGPWAFVNSMRGGFIKSWKREKQEEGEGKNTMAVVSSWCSPSTLSTACLSSGWRFLTKLYPCARSIKMYEDMCIEMKRRLNYAEVRTLTPTAKKKKLKISPAI